MGNATFCIKLAFHFYQQLLALINTELQPTHVWHAHRKAFESQQTILENFINSHYIKAAMYHFCFDFTYLPLEFSAYQLLYSTFIMSKQLLR
jgi:predicted transcriptional regulator